MSDILITIAGVRGAGKTIIAQAVSKALDDYGLNVVLQRSEQRVSMSNAHLRRRLTALAANQERDGAEIIISTTQLPSPVSHGDEAEALQPTPKGATGSEVAFEPLTIRQFMFGAFDESSERQRGVLNAGLGDEFHCNRSMNLTIPMRTAKRILRDYLREQVGKLNVDINTPPGEAP